MSKTQQPHDSQEPQENDELFGDPQVFDEPIADNLEQQIAELTEALQRERADATNLRRRHDEQVGRLKTTVKASVVKDLLPVVDNFERAIKNLPQSKDISWNEIEGIERVTESDLAQKIITHAKEESKQYKQFTQGVQSIFKQFEKTLSKIGVERIKTVGEPFDPHWHEAVSVEDGDGDDEVVSEELQAGYHIDGEVVRHAMVRVTRK